MFFVGYIASIVVVAGVLVLMAVRGALLWAWIASLALTAVQIALMAIGGAQTGKCFPSDPIPDCPDAYGLAGIHFILIIPTAVTALIALVLTAVVAWRFALREPLRTVRDRKAET